MPRVSSHVILEVAVEAARKGSVDSDEQNLNARDVGLLNEQWTQSYVGDAISRHLQSLYGVDRDRPFVTFETTVSWLDYFFDQKRSPGRIPGKLTNKNRFDISVWSPSGKAIGLIEIKNEPLMSSYSKSRDPDKLVGALRRWHNLKWGIFIFCVRNNTKKDGPNLVSHLRSKVKGTFEHVESRHRKGVRLSLKVAPILDEPNAQCMWAAILFRRK